MAAEERLAQLEKDIVDTEALLEETQRLMSQPDIAADYEKLSQLSDEISRLQEVLQQYYEELDTML